MKLLPRYIWIFMLITFIITVIIMIFGAELSNIYGIIIAFIGVITGFIALISMIYYWIYCPIKKKKIRRENGN